MCNQQCDRARSLIEDFNSKASKKVDIDKFFEKLEDLGAVDDESFALLKWEHLQQCGLPLLLAQKIATEAFRVRPQVLSEDKPNGHKLSVKKMRVPELLQACDPSDKEDPFTIELIKRIGTKRFVVYSDESSCKLDHRATMELYDELDDGESEIYQDADGVRAVFRLGEKPIKLRDEHPMFPGEFLRTTGWSATGIGWGALSLELRQLVRIAMETGELANKDEHDVFGYANSGSIKSRCPKAVLELQRLEQAGQAPTLKAVVRPVAVTKVSKSNNPFANRVV